MPEERKHSDMLFQWYVAESDVDGHNIYAGFLIATQLWNEVCVRSKRKTPVIVPNDAFSKQTLVATRDLIADYH